MLECGAWCNNCAQCPTVVFIVSSESFGFKSFLFSRVLLYSIEIGLQGTWWTLYMYYKMAATNIHPDKPDESDFFEASRLYGCGGGGTGEGHVRAHALPLTGPFAGKLVE